jgi:hypothetical protein
VLSPLASRYGLNVVTGVGELSLSACRDLSMRAKGNGGRPVRILYVSDFDPAGQSMPVAVSRKIEWLSRNLEDVFLDIELYPVVLSHEQCVKYRLPRTPIKESERRAGRFEQRFGAGATELDALEALYHGELRKILVAEIERFLDPTLPRRWLVAKGNTQDQLDEIEQSVIDLYAENRAELQARLDALRREVGERARQLETDLRALDDAMREQMIEQARPIIDDLEMPSLRDADEWDAPLYDSGRDYVEQIGAYKAFQGKPTERKAK